MICPAPPWMMIRGFVTGVPREPMIIAVTTDEKGKETRKRSLKYNVGSHRCLRKEVNNGAYHPALKLEIRAREKASRRIFRRLKCITFAASCQLKHKNKWILTSCLEPLTFSMDAEISEV